MDIVKVVEPFAVAREQEVHREAMTAFGEQVVLRQVWQYDDFEAGRVARCSECAVGSDIATKDRITNVYKQSGSSFCESCYGIGFEGGYKPTIYVMFVIIRSSPDDLRRGREGQQFTEQNEAEFLWFPKLREGDLLVRVLEWAVDDVTPIIERSRYRLGPVKQERLVTGPRFNVRDQQDTVIGQTAPLQEYPERDPLQIVPIS